MAGTLDAYEREELTAMIREVGLVGVLEAISDVCDVLHAQQLRADPSDAEAWFLRLRIAKDAADLGRAIGDERGLRL